MSRGAQPKRMTQKELMTEGYIFRDTRDEHNHRERWEALEKIQNWDDLASDDETNFYLQDCIIFALQQRIDSDGGIIDRVGSERPKQALYCRMHMHIGKLAIRKLQSTMKKPVERPLEVEDEYASEERSEISKT